MTQAKARPPTFVLFCSRAERCRRPTSAIWSTRCARHFDLPGTPIRLTLREKENPFAHKRKRPS